MKEAAKFGREEVKRVLTFKEEGTNTLARDIYFTG